MFDRIAPRYDLLNHVLSCNVDRTWWWRTARRFRSVLERPEAKVLDICCGTGDMTLALLRRRPENAEPVVAADFSPQMLVRARAKLAGRGASVVEADALHLPFADGSLDLITTAFGFRNLANYSAGLGGVFSHAGTGRRSRDSRFQRTVGSGGTFFSILFSACAAVDWGADFRRPRGVRVLAGVGGEVSSAAGDGGVDAGGGFC
jgi:demethylmenaquinone methyltransferase/2-methoxy-6-polyprenyl-1,4-benzoquinol methylase